MSDALNSPLMWSHVAIPTQNMGRPAQRRTPVFSRSGSRVAIQTPNTRPTGAMMDVTALLVAEYLGVLDDIEAYFDVIKVPSNLGEVLFDMSTELSVPQPGRAAALRELRALVNAHRVTVVDVGRSAGRTTTFLPELYRLAQERDAAVVDFLPVVDVNTGVPSAEQPPEIQNQGINIASLVSSLQEHGMLTEAQAEVARANLGNEGRDRVGTVRSEQPLFLAPSVAPLLVEAGLITQLGRTHDLYVTSDELAYVDAQLADYDQRSALSERLHVISERVRRRLEDHRYSAVQIPNPPPSELGPGQQHIPPTWVASLSLQSSVAGRLADNDLVVVEDRYVNRWYTREDGKAIVGIVDVLELMLRDGLLDREKYYSLLTKLRMGFFFFVEITAEEILHHLRRAQVSESAIVETLELTTLRQYLSAMLQQRDLLADDSAAPNERIVLGFVSNAVRNALIAVMDEEPSAESQARARWIVESLYSDDLEESGLIAQSALGSSSPTDIATALMLYRALSE